MACHEASADAAAFNDPAAERRSSLLSIWPVAGASGDPSCPGVHDPSVATRRFGLRSRSSASITLVQMRSHLLARRFCRTALYLGPAQCRARRRSASCDRCGRCRWPPPCGRPTRTRIEKLGNRPALGRRDRERDLGRPASCAPTSPKVCRRQITWMWTLRASSPSACATNPAARTPSTASVPL